MGLKKIISIFVIVIFLVSLVSANIEINNESYTKEQIEFMLETCAKELNRSNVTNCERKLEMYEHDVIPKLNENIVERNENISRLQEELNNAREDWGIFHNKYVYLGIILFMLFVAIYFYGKYKLLKKSMSIFGSPEK